jgi:hypothetical protein
MKAGKTFLTIFAILATSILAGLLANNSFALIVKVDIASKSNLSGTGLIFLATDLLIAVTFCTTVWLTLVWNAGDRLPPIVMLLVGFFGWVMHIVNLFTDLRWQRAFWLDLFNGIHWLSAFWQSLGIPWGSAFWVTLFSNPFIYTLNAMFIAFGIAGLFSGRRSK